MQTLRKLPTTSPNSASTTGAASGPTSGASLLKKDWPLRCRGQRNRARRPVAPGTPSVRTPPLDGMLRAWERVERRARREGHRPPVGIQLERMPLGIDRHPREEPGSDQVGPRTRKRPSPLLVGANDLLERGDRIHRVELLEPERGLRAKPVRVRRSQHVFPETP